MGRKFKLLNDWKGDNGTLYKNPEIEINSGLTVLVGCNGSGKTTALEQIHRQLINDEIPVLFHDNHKQGEREALSKASYRQNFEMMAKLMMSSEGENIKHVLENVATDMGALSRSSSSAKELWFLFDAIDSGFSVDNIVELKTLLFPIVSKTNQDKGIYFVTSANEYELARGENCFDIANGRYIRFADYEEYRDFILKSREEKDKRIDELCKDSSDRESEEEE